MKLNITFLSIITFSNFAADISEHILMNDHNRKLLFKLAGRFSDRIDEQFPNKTQIICGLGQSPAYLIETLKLIDQHRQRRDREYKLVAFSGNFFAQVDKDERPIKKARAAQHDDAFEEFCAIHADKVEFDKDMLPSWQHRRDYRRYLKTIGFSQQDLLSPDKEFVLIDRCHYGLGLRSFLYIIQHYEKKPTIFFMHNYLSFINSSPQSITLNKEEYDVMFALSFDTNSTKFKDRLVQLFKRDAWRTIDPAQFKPHENALIILEELKKFHEIEIFMKFIKN